jgi:hypothetical protein
MPTQPVQQDSEEGEPLLREEDEFSVPSMKQTQQTSNTACEGCKSDNKVLFQHLFLLLRILYHFLEYALWTRLP